METALQKKEESMKETIESKREAINMFTKFWQTPTTIQDSPINNLTEYNASEKDQSKMKGNLTQDFYDFLNNDPTKNEDLEIFNSDEVEKENLEQLTDELIQLFNFDNIDKSSDLQKRGINAASSEARRR